MDEYRHDRGAHLFWSVEKWRVLQSRRLVDHLEWAGRSGLYQEKGLGEIARQLALSPNFDAVFKKLPFTTKDDVARAGNAAWAVQPEEVAEWVCTSGTAGKPLDVPLTKHDLERLAENEAVALGIAGVREGDLFVLAVGMDRMFVAGLAYWLGARKLGATCVRVGPQMAGHLEMLGEIVKRVSGTAQRVFVIAVPSFLASVKRPSSGLAGVIGIGEPVRGSDLEYNFLGRRLKEQLGCAVMSTYALTETCASFAEGPMCKGGHLNPELAVLEVVDDSGRSVADGEVGEIVVTPLGMEGMPLVRFRTGDMAALYADTCACGRTTPRVGPIMGRRQQLLKVRGTNVYPAAIIEALRSIPEVADCVIVAEREESGAELSDRVTVFVQMREGADLRANIENRLRAVLRVTPEVRLVEEAELRAMMFSTGVRKAQRFIDRRGR